MTKPQRSLSSAVGGMRQSVFATLQEKITAFQQGGGDLIALHIGDTYLDPPAGTTNTGDDDAIARYGKVPGLIELKAALASRAAARGMSHIEGPDNIHVGCGCTHALFCAVRAALNPGESMLVVSPYWPLVIGVLQTAGIEAIDVPLTQTLFAEPNAAIEPLLEAALKPSTKGLYFITPNNPDGYVYSEQNLTQLAAFAKRHDLWVFADEVYSDFVYEGEHRSIASLEGMAERTITCSSMSKSHGMSGARIGSISASAAFIGAARRISNHTVYNVPVAMQQAALAALDDGGAWLEEARERYLEARDGASRSLQRHGFKAHLPQGGSFFFVDMADQLADHSVGQLLGHAIERGVLLAPGDAFGRGYEKHLRLCFTGAHRSRIEEGIERLARAVEELRP